MSTVCHCGRHLRDSKPRLCILRKLIFKRDQRIYKRLEFRTAQEDVAKEPHANCCSNSEKEYSTVGSKSHFMGKGIYHNGPSVAEIVTSSESGERGVQQDKGLT